jgi:hypothetical protein
VIHDELTVSCPTSGPVQFLSRGVDLRDIQAHAAGPEGPSVLFNRSKQRRGDATTPAWLGNEQVVEDEDSCQSRGREAGIELGKADRLTGLCSQEHNRLSVVEPVLQEGAAGREVRRLALKLAVLVEELRKHFEVREYGLPNGDCVHAVTGRGAVLWSLTFEVRRERRQAL